LGGDRHALKQHAHLVARGGAELGQVALVGEVCGFLEFLYGLDVLTPCIEDAREDNVDLWVLRVNGKRGLGLRCGAIQHSEDQVDGRPLRVETSLIGDQIARLAEAFG
jgi:hypothetical protein